MVCLLWSISKCSVYTNNCATLSILTGIDKVDLLFSISIPQINFNRFGIQFTYSTTTLPLIPQYGSCESSFHRKPDYNCTCSNSCWSRITNFHIFRCRIHLSLWWQKMTPIYRLSAKAVCMNHVLFAFLRSVLTIYIT